MAKSTATAKPAACPCGGALLDACCGPYLRGTAIAATAEQLMRSRYSAYVLGDEPYLQASWHPSTRPAQTAMDATAKWLGLEVRAARQTGEHSATVEFVARCRFAGGAQRLHEISRFVREDGRWFYVDGSFPEK